ncbi:peroxiredoxin-like family protein [Aquimarina agarilytica]|uniref:peroxiredoxin-like family protein n=1 Tax=Aquimarina agarilytica TaxID=1087449 RepID=UPI00028A2143|nr:peroxiredoxin-like family protein [Aquimarina agarilytica]
MSLTAKLQETKKAFSKNVPADVQAIMSNALNTLTAEGLPKTATKKGDLLTDATLVAIDGKEVNVHSFLKDGPLVVSFYRGGWCPYCNVELKELQDALPQIKELGANLVAITPETPDNSLTTSEKNNISFSVLSDIDNKYAKQLGLVFQMPEDLREVYHQFNIDVPKHNQNKDYELPLPATYVVNIKGEIVLSFLPEDYTERLDPVAIIDALKSL